MPVHLWQNDQSRLVSFLTLTYCLDESMSALTAREVRQVLRDVAFGRRMMFRGMRAVFAIFVHNVIHRRRLELGLRLPNPSQPTRQSLTAN
ncbi:hypothetical protein DLD99_06120 [Pseudomonas kribbensis]|uniref:Uncharacterized protein n=1 Tax=Pseudomonas kribbensis TaxID=1628086 RepID=A0A345RL95_9PSED|nr:hypothetical protein DLD99_06120 [Pseudomonas kribbensis]